MQNELSQLSRHLSSYWGMANEKMIEEIFEEEVKHIELNAGEVLLFLTDGIYLPIVRSLMDQTNYHLSVDDYYLEHWLEEFIRSAGYTNSEKKDKRIEDLLPDLADYCTQYTANRKRYRDDIAAIQIYASQTG